MSTQTLSLNLKITGPAGAGIMTSSKIVARVLQKLGYQIFNYYEYPSLIKGGQQTGQVYAAEQAFCQKRALDLLITLDPTSLPLYQGELTPNTIIVGEFADQPATFTDYQGVKASFYNFPLEQLAVQASGSKISINAVATGAAFYLAGVEFKQEIIQTVLNQEFADKPAEVIAKILATFVAGYQVAQATGSKEVKFNQAQTQTLLMTGSEAIGLGALAGGIQYYSAYPMTPASGLLHFLAEQQNNYPLVVKHVEDEIAAINQAIGAAYAGVRAMTGSAGGGFALMVEALSLIGVAEVPLAILVAQRGAPGTGLPTWTSQADLEFVLTAGHGDFVRVVLTPGTVEEHFQAGKLALELAERYQIPVLILSDKLILESHQTMPMPATQYTVERYSMAGAAELKPDNSYRRYRVTDNGISPRSIPGQDFGLGITNSYEHDEFGFATELAEPIIAQVNKRQKKMSALSKEVPQPVLLGPAQAQFTMVGWGSTVNVFKQLLAWLELDQPGQTLVNMIHLPCMWPFPTEQFQQLASQAKHLVMVEANVTGQGAKLIRQETGIDIKDKILRYDGRPFYAEDLLIWLKNQLAT